MLPEPALTLKTVPLTSLDGLSSDDYARWVAEALSSVNLLLASLPAAKPSSTVWHPKRLYHTKTYPTQTWSSGRRETVPGTGATDGFRWHVRQSKHPREDGTYEQFKDGLLVDHSKKESEYIESCTEAKLVKTVFPGELEVWQTKYNNSPASNRDFTFLLLTRDTTPAPSASQTSAPSHAESLVSPGPKPLRSFVVVSIPADVPAEKGFVRGRYVSLEHVQETEEGGVVWTMAVSSDPGGWVPKLISEHVMPQKIAEDVPSFIEWLTKRPAA
ncbi:hypothetical protein JCM10213_003086 [Rhodosporidiobolus nylandii]